MPGNTEWASTNSDAFTIYPHGEISGLYGVDDVAKAYGFWWSSTQSSFEDALYGYLGHNYQNVNKGNSSKKNGFSIRCLKE